MIYRRILHHRYFKAISGSALIKIANILLGFLLTVLLARILGAEDYGIYSYVFALVTLITIPTKMGIPEVLIRETSKLQADDNKETLKGLWRWAAISNFSLSLFAILCCSILLFWYKNNLSPKTFDALLWGVLLIPFMTLASLRGAILVGLRNVILGQIPDNFIRPLFLLLITLFASLTTFDIRPSSIVIFHLGACCIAFICGIYFLYSKAPNISSYKPHYKIKEWTLSALPLAVTSGMFVLNQQIDLIALGILASAEDVGIYKVISQVGICVIFGQQMVKMATSSNMARYWHKKEMYDLQHIVRICTITSFSIAALTSIFFLIFGKQFLLILFGVEYAAGYNAMIILCIGQLLNAAFGPVGTLLSMTGNERYCVYGMSISIIVNIALNALLIPLYGIEGAAISTSLSIAVWNTILWLIVRQKLSIKPTVLSV